MNFRIFVYTYQSDRSWTRLPMKFIYISFMHYTHSLKVIFFQHFVCLTFTVIYPWSHVNFPLVHDGTQNLLNFGAFWIYKLEMFDVYVCKRERGRQTGRQTETFRGDLSLLQTWEGMTCPYCAESLEPHVWPSADVKTWCFSPRENITEDAGGALMHPSVFTHVPHWTSSSIPVRAGLNTIWVTFFSGSICHEQEK